MLIRGGRVVTEQGVHDADVLIEDGTIAAIEPGLAPDGNVTVDADGCWVLPGGVDPHVHTSQEGHSINEPMLDDLEEASRVALLGGVTTIGAYAQRIPDAGLLEMLERQIAFGRRASYTDFWMNALCFPGDDVNRIVDEGVNRLGVRAYKGFLAYHNRGLMMEDDMLLDVMRGAVKHGAVVLVHPENGRIIDRLEQIEFDQGDISNDAFLRTAPPEIEVDGMVRTAMLARLTGCKVVFVHLTSRLGAETATWLKSIAGEDRIVVETQPHYLFLTNQAVLERGPLAKVGPAIKEEEDREAVREAARTGLLSHLSSDHSPRSSSVKFAADNILHAPYGGISGTEVLVPLAHRLMEEGLIDITRLAELIATNAAKAYGAYPRKGTLRPGSDGDAVIIPIDGDARAITPANLHGASDYSLYEGIASAGFPRYVVKGGRLAVEDGTIVERIPGRHLGGD